MAKRYLSIFHSDLIVFILIRVLRHKRVEKRILCKIPTLALFFLLRILHACAFCTELSEAQNECKVLVAIQCNRIEKHTIFSTLLGINAYPSVPSITLVFHLIDICPPAGSPHLGASLFFPLFQMISFLECVNLQHFVPEMMSFTEFTFL